MNAVVRAVDCDPPSAPEVSWEDALAAVQDERDHAIRLLRRWLESWMTRSTPPNIKKENMLKKDTEDFLRVVE